MFLTQEELQVMTGYEQAAYQITWLRQNGFNFRIRGDGKPIVLEAHVNAEMGAEIKPERKRTQPDREAFIKHQRRISAKIPQNI